MSKFILIITAAGLRLSPDIFKKSKKLFKKCRWKSNSNQESTTNSNLPGNHLLWSSWHPSCTPFPWLVTPQNCFPYRGSLCGPRGMSPPLNHSGLLTMSPAEAKKTITSCKSEKCHLYITKVILIHCCHFMSFFCFSNETIYKTQKKGYGTCLDVASNKINIPHMVSF